MSITYSYHSQTKLREGNVFTPSVHGGVRGKVVGMFIKGGMHGKGGACMVKGGDMHAAETTTEAGSPAVRILLECILVIIIIIIN